MPLFTPSAKLPIKVQSTIAERGPLLVRCGSFSDLGQGSGDVRCAPRTQCKDTVRPRRHVAKVIGDSHRPLKLRLLNIYCF